MKFELLLKYTCLDLELYGRRKVTILRNKKKTTGEKYLVLKKLLEFLGNFNDFLKMLEFDRNYELLRYSRKSFRDFY